MSETIYKVHVGDFFVEPGMLNHLGILHGGCMVRQCDSALGLVAEQYVGERVLTVAIKDFDFKERTYVGDRIDFEVSLVTTSTHTMTFYVGVNKLGFGRSPVLVGEGIFVFIAVNQDFRPIPVPPLKIKTEEQGRFVSEVNSRFGLASEDNHQSSST